jgi:hypothetical protein
MKRTWSCSQGHSFSIDEDGTAAVAIALSQTRARFAGTCDEYGPFGSHGERRRCGESVVESEERG